MGTRRAAWLITVGGAKPLRLVSTCAPTACPERFTSSIDALTISSRSRASVSPTGSGAIIAATRLPSAPRSFSARTLTGTIARSTGSLSSAPRRRKVAPKRPGDDREHHVVDRAAELVLHGLHVAQGRPDPGEAPVRADPPVVAASPAAGEGPPRPSLPGPPAPRPRRAPRVAGRAARRASCAPPRPEPWPAPAGPPRAAAPRAARDAPASGRTRRRSVRGLGRCRRAR